MAGYLSTRSRLWTSLTIPLTVFLALCCRQPDATPLMQAQERGFSKTYQDFAIQKKDLPSVMAGHPRLYIRTSLWRHGPSLDELKQWSHSAPLRSYLKAKPWDRKPGVEWAFRYLLTGDESLVPHLVTNMKAKGGYWPGYLTTLATIYDWTYNSPNFIDSDKRIVEDKMIAWAKSAIQSGERYQDMWSHFGYGQATDLAAAGLALSGHRKEGEEFLAMAGGYLKNNFLPAWHLNEGAWQGGWTYYSQGPARLMTLIHLWSAGTEEDMYQFIAQEQGDWLRKHLYYLLSSTYGDSGPLETGGFSYAPNIKGRSEVMLRITYAYQDINGIAALKYLQKVPWSENIWQFIFYSPQMHGSKTEPGTIPLSQLWGRTGIGYSQMRGGWEKRDTLIDFKCGDYFWSHQFHNQNSFTIYHGGELAVQSGIYDEYYGRHNQFYYRPTIGSNSMLVIQPGETTWIPPAAARQAGIPNNNGHLREYGGQRSCFMIPGAGSAETCFSFEKYLYRKDHEHHFETGTMQSWEVEERYTYASGDATMAYNNFEFSYPGNKPKLDHASRDLLFLDKKYLLVFDRVNTLDKNYEKRWLLHTIGKPQVSGPKLEEQVPGHIISYQAEEVRVDNNDGTLFLKTLFPVSSKLRLVGGSPSITESRPAAANRGSGTLNTIVTGPYSALGGTIATDASQPEEWTLQFTSKTDFEAFGSKTGADGRGSSKTLFLSKSSSLLIPSGNWKGAPQKGDRFTFSTTSSSYRFWVDGKQNLPDIKKVVHVVRDGSKVHPGNWRIEVTPSQPQGYDSFLHFLYPCDRDTPNMPAVQAIRSQNALLQGMAVDDWVALFRVWQPLNGITRYEVPVPGIREHLILGLNPENMFRVVLHPIQGDAKQIHTVKASREGVLSFKADSPVVVEIEPLSSLQ